MPCVVFFILFAESLEHKKRIALLHLLAYTHCGTFLVLAPGSERRKDTRLCLPRG
jgi:hypothetical protein